MPTKAPRIAITVPPATLAVLAKLSALQRRPRSTIAADLLEELTPALQRIAALLEAAAKSREKLPADTAAKLNALQDLMAHTATFGLERLAANLTPPAGAGPASAKAPRGRRRKQH